MQTQTITIQELIRKIKKVKYDQSKIIWEQFVKWLYFQFKSDHHVSFGFIGNYGYKIQEKSGQKIPILFFNNNYLKQIGLRNLSQSFILKPKLKINMVAIASNCPESIDRQSVEMLLNGIIDRVDKIIRDLNQQSIVINLDILGKITKTKNQILFDYYIPQPPPNRIALKHGVSSLRDIVEREGTKTQMGFHKTTLLIKKQGLFPKIQLPNTQRTLQRPNSFRKISLSREKQQKTKIIKQQEKQLTISKQQEKPIKRSLDRKKSGSLRALQKVQKQQALGWQMMGAGKDPLKKDHDYAKLTADPKQLMRTTFLYKRAEQVQNVPIIDVFARTLACPVATQRQNPMVAARIGSNLSLQTQYFQINSDCIHNLIIKSQTLQKRIKIKQKDKYEMSDAQQYSLIIKQVRTAEDQYKLKQRKKNYQKYILLFDMIDDKNICQFKQTIMKNILIKIDSKIENPHLITKMINQVIQDYMHSLKKSIIDYILLDPTQQDRLAVYIKYKSIHLYGEPQHCIMPLKNNESLLNRNSSVLQANLLKNSPYYLLIQKIWLQKYANLQLVSMPKPNDPYIHIDEFIDKQKLKLKSAKQLIINEWMPTLAKIYRDQITLLTRNQQKCQKFFQSGATFLSLQIRELIEKQMRIYLQYFKQYDLKILNPPDTVVFLQKTQNKYQNCFLNVRISHRKDQIYFMDQMQQLEDKFLSVIDNLRAFSQKLPRPENLITKTDKLFIPFIDYSDQYFMETRKQIKRIVNTNLVNVSKSIQIFNKFRYILVESRAIDKWIIDGKHDRRQYALTFQKYNQVYDDIMDKIPFFIRMNMVNIDSDQLKHYMLKCTQQIIKKLQKSVFDLVIAKKDEIRKQLQGMILTASSKINDCKTLVKIQNQVDSYRRNGIRRLQQKNTDLVKWIGITLYNTCYVTSQQDLGLIKDTSQFLHKIYQKLDRQDALIFQQRKKLEGIAANDSKYFNTKVKQSEVQIEKKLKQFGNKIFKDQAIQFLKKNRQITNSFMNFVQNLNQRELLLGMNETVSTKIHQLDKILKPFEQLWQLIVSYHSYSQSWTRDSIFKLNSDDIEIQAKTMYKSAVQLSSNPIINKVAPTTIKVAEQLIQQISDFQKNIPVIAVFSNPGLNQRHFVQIQQLISYEGQPLSKKSNLNLYKAISLGAGQHIQELQVISQNATKQYMIETTIIKINAEWENMKFEMKNYKQSDTKILTGGSIEQIQTLLDDHSLKLITMKGSLHAKIFEAPLTQIQEWLNYTNLMIDYSAKVQSTWMYLQPVMTSPDILKHLSVEGAKFRVIDQAWKDITKFYADKLLIKQITKNTKIAGKLKQSLAHLQIVMKGLNSYLQSKRLSFPRFFFLSNQQLLQILSQTKDPTKVQPHLKKCFQGIARLQFEDNKFITGMYSQQSQFVEFTSKINTALARGNVDEWLNEVEDRMIKSLVADISKCHDNYQRKSRKQCLFLSCAMSVLTVQMTNWTKSVQISIQQENISKAVKKTNNQLIETVNLIKDYSKIKKVDVITLQALIVLSVHNLDIVKNLQRLKIQHLYSFEWESQLRYYYKEWDNGDLKTLVKILNATCDFNHQYLGNTSRLVITPLTDRCYRTLCSAIYLNYGGAPEGPAGTGKTQTVKDLAKALANQCVVFNCSDGLDYKAMGKFFKGLAASGAWSCFDEFNRINLQVLSVVAQQILCIQTAKAKNQKVLIFEQAQLKLKKNANCFITMNPGYAGRSQLPDNLKALFRSVAMMIPDYAMIAQISLYSYGFASARSLARKIVSTYKLCSEQLSFQQHYDYGMRAVKSVLIAAGNLKRKYNDLQQSSLVLKAINDVNVAKFLNFDIPLFNGITSDLFKDVQPPKINYEALTNKIVQIFCEHNLTQSSYSLQKIIQIYDMILVRHGLMVVGYPFSGKTTALNILAEALKQCQAQMNQMEVESCRINPKSISMKQLYGSFDQVSHEWFDGVLAVKFRAFASSTTPKRKWIILDGPVDAVWIQNMNTVLDDNKKLCLNSGQIISMNKQMSLIFEPMDLLAASPATVSRCGMIYMQPASLGHQVLIESWFKANDWLSLDLIINLKDFFKLLPLLFKQIQKTMKTICYVDIFNLTQTLLRNLQFQLEPIKRLMQTQIGKQFVGNEKNTFGLVSSLFGYACTWSFGGAVDTGSRKLFDAGFKKIIISEIVLANKKKKVGFPDKATLYDYMLKIDQQKCNYQWTKWIDLIQPSQKPKKFQPHNIIVITADSLKYNYIIQNSLSRDLPILLCGPTGTGKTTLVKSIGQKSANNQCSFLSIVLSSKTTCKQVAEQVQSKLDKKGSRNLIGPKQNRMIIYVDDLNMPIKQKYGAQPPIQYFRQLLDQRGIYDFKEKDKNFKKIIDVSYLYSMAALNNDITPRFLRHSTILSIANFEEESLGRIFITILGFSFQGHSQYKNINNILKNSIELYNQCVQILKPTPMKSHYIFNLRDLSKLITGICRADKLKIHSENIGRLWGHEARRVFVDRLLPEDKHIVETFIETIGKRWGKNMNVTYFTDILSPSHQRSYEEIPDLEKVSMTVSSALANYNLVTDKPMDLVLFNYALQHILIILRILRQPKGHALLVGLGGSGRKSFTYLSSFIAQLQSFSLQITKNYGFVQFRQDIKKLFIEIGVKNKQISFLFADTMIKDEQFLEDINNILNIGFVPNLFTAEQKIQICQNVRKDALQQTGVELNLDQLFQYFVKKVGNNIKLVLCFSPIGDGFRTRMRMFPSLVNCTTIDWFTEWPKEGLLSVGQQFLKSVDLKNKQAYIELLQFIHSSSKKWSQIFYQQKKRKFYVTPTSFIEFITSFKQILGKKRKQIKELIYKYENGYAKIVQTEIEVQKMKKNLQQMKPMLKAADDTSIKMEMVKIQKQEADEIMAQISGEEKIVLQAVDQANAIKQDCQKQLAVAMPQLKAAQNALLVLDKNSLTELKSMMNPPIGVRMTLQGLCLLIDPNPKQKMKNDKTLKMETDWWAASIRLLGNPKLLSQLVNFNKQALTQNVINNLGKFLTDPENKQTLAVANVAKSSLACECIIQWVNGIYNFYFVNKKVKPKKQSLKVAEEKVAKLNEKLQAKRAQLDSANSKVEQLRYELEWAQKNKQKLQKQYSECEIALNRAEIIMSSLGSQKLRWYDFSQKYKQEEKSLDKKIFMASAQIIYFGAFTQAFRTRIIQEWLPQFAMKKLQLSQQYSLVQVLGNPVQIRAWNINGLPYDNFSVQNGLIIYNSRRWPLMIDPQGQANKWLKKQEATRKIKIIKPFEDNFIRNLQNCIQFGTPVLIQNLGQQINVALTPILLKQTYKKGASTYLKMGENILIYSSDFFLYMTTKLTNPHYLPQVCTQTAIINFMITEEGLSEQLLALIVSKERPDLEKQKQKLIIQSAANKKTLKQIQDKILDILGNSSNILGDQTAINVLSASKQKSNQINQKQLVSEQTQIQIDKARSNYSGVSKEGSSLFFAVSALQNLQSMYQYSLTYFMDLYAASIQNSKKSVILKQRLQQFKQYFRVSLYRNIGRSLFQKDRLIFSILIAIRLSNIPLYLIDYLISSGDSSKMKMSILKPKVNWMTDSMWKNMLRLSQIQAFQNLLISLNSQQNIQICSKIVKSENPFNQKLPPVFQCMQQIYKVLLLKVFRPQKMIQNCTLFVKNSIGEEFVQSLPFDLQKIYPDSNSTTPILFILSPGSDPFIAVSNYAKAQNIQLDSISLGQGQGPIAQRLIKQNIQKGGWVILQNCHLATSWMPSLQKIVQQFEDDQKDIHPNFRLWLTSYPTNDFPQSVLQKSLKITNEPAKGLKNNLTVSYLSDPINNEEYFEGSLCEKAFKKLIYSLSFFHAVIQQRKKYGPLGWNIPYQFNESDLRISCKQLKIYVDEVRNQQLIPFNALNYLIAECNYGGKVTDQNDRRLLNTLLEERFNRKVLKDENHNYGNSDDYILPNNLKQHGQFMAYIQNLPSSSSPQLVGLHPNADITKDFNQSNLLVQSLMSCVSSTGSSGKAGSSQQEVVAKIICDLLEQSTFPTIFNLQQVLKKYPIIYQDSMNTVLNQQIGRYNRLIDEIKRTLVLIAKAIKGEQVMTQQLQKMYKSLYQNKVPDLWLAKSYPSLKPLSSYFADLIERVNFFQTWVAQGIPAQFWLSGFFFTQSFLTGILQNYSRLNKIPVDQLSFNFIFKREEIAGCSQGANIYGLFIEGAQWDDSKQILRQSNPGVIFGRCPNFYIKPTKTQQMKIGKCYQAPLYKTIARRGVLSTTGHSTNFVMMVNMPIENEPTHWIKRGVALLTQIN